MPIIDQKGGNYWIESIEVARATVVAAGQRDSGAINLERGGVFIGVSVTINSDTTNASGAQVTTAAAGELNIGDSITQVRFFARNTSGASQELGMHCLVYMRKVGRR